MRTRRPTMFLASLATVAFLAGCGGGGDDADAGDDGIASLGTTPTAQEESPTTTAPAALGDDSTNATDTTNGSDDSSPIDSVLTEGTTSADDPPSTDPEQAMLDFAQCMRENGIDMPDPEFSGDGNGGGVMVATQEGEGDGNQPSREEFEAAQEECQPLMDAAESQIERDPEREAEMREQMLAFAECMREHGIDMPDPEFGENGQMSVQIGDPDSEGPSFDDEEFQEANEACGGEGDGMAIGAGPAGSLPEGDE